MNKKVLVLLAAAMLLLTTSVAWAVPTINIDDLGEGNPGYSFSGFVLPAINPAVTGIDEEFINITGTLYSHLINNGNAAAYGVKMLEPASEAGGVSDFATLIVSPYLGSLLGQPFNLTFFSDGADGFHAALIAFNLAFPGAPSIVEDGTLQNLFNFSGLVVNAASDVAPVPVPPGVLLMGSGLLGMGILRFRKSC